MKRLIFALSLVACAPTVHPLPLPAIPADAHTAFLVVPGALAVGPVQGPAVELPLLTGEQDGPMALIYSRATLAELQLEPGAVPRGGTRPPPAIATLFERREDAWHELDELGALPASLSGVRLPAYQPTTCQGAGGCGGFEPEPELCLTPCPCPKAVDGLRDRWSFPLECELPQTPRSNTCYLPPRLFTALNALGAAWPNSSRAMLGQVIEEAGRTMAYFETDRFAVPAAPDDGIFTQVGRVELTGLDTLEVATATRVALTAAPSRAGPRGWISAPRLSTDALQLYTHGSVPDANFNDEELFFARRSALSEPFGAMEPIVALTDPDNAPVIGEAGDEGRHPLLFPDDRTLLYKFAVDRHETIAYARRRTTDSTDLAFVPIDRDLVLPSKTVGWALSADHTHLLCAVDDGATVARFYAVPIVSLEPVTYGDPVPLTLANRSPIELRSWYDMYVSEHPSGDAIYVGVNGDTWILEATPCR